MTNEIDQLDLNMISYEILKNKFIENFKVNHLTLDLMNRLEENKRIDIIKSYIINEFTKEFNQQELIDIFG